jgi:hypothetical protein
MHCMIHFHYKKGHDLVQNKTKNVYISSLDYDFATMK